MLVQGCQCTKFVNLWSRVTECTCAGHVLSSRSSLQKAVASQLIDEKELRKDETVIAALENKEVSNTGVQTDSDMIDDLQVLKKENEELVIPLHETRGELSKMQMELLECKEQNAVDKDQLSILQKNKEVNRNLLQEREEALD